MSEKAIVESRQKILKNPRKVTAGMDLYASGLFLRWSGMLKAVICAKNLI